MLVADEITEIAELAERALQDAAESGDAPGCRALRAAFEDLAVAAAMRAHAIDAQASGELVDARHFHDSCELRLGKMLD
jgi:hypothetical protein